MPEPFTPLQVAQLYDFPTGLDGSGQCIAIIELGGGYIMKDLQTYFAGLGVGCRMSRTSRSSEGAMLPGATPMAR